jgi:regulatory subunit for Cdc7p protein kinase
MSNHARPPLAKYAGNQSSKRPRSPDKLSAVGVKRARSTTHSKQIDLDAKVAKRAQREADQERFRTKYREEFPKWSFFFTTSLPPEVRATFAGRVQELGARYETFFSSKVTHVITSQRISTVNTSNKENVSKTAFSTLRSPIKLTVKPSRTDEDMMEKAKQFGMKIWEIDKLDSVLNRTQHSAISPKPSRSQKLNEMLEAERRTGITYERDPQARRNDYEYFPKNSYFVLIEDMSGQYSTIAAQDYPIKTKNGAATGPWPSLYLHPQVNCPFGPFDEKENRRRDQTLELERIRKHERKLREQEKMKQAQAARNHSIANLRRTVSMGNLMVGGSEDPDGVATYSPEEAVTVNASGYLATGYLAASGNSVSVISGTGTTSVTGAMPRSTAPLALRRQIANQVVVRRNLGDAQAQPSLRKTKSTTSMRQPKREETVKPGFCESCKIKFQDFGRVSSSLTLLAYPEFPTACSIQTPSAIRLG